MLHQPDRWQFARNALGWFAGNRRARKAAAARRRSRVRRHAAEQLEMRVVLNADPVAMDDEFTILRDQPAFIAELVLANDSDPDGDPLSITAWTYQTQQGGYVAYGPQGQLLYTPPTGFVGDDVFNYTISDGQGTFSSAAVTVHVQAPPNTPPTGADRAFELREDGPLSVGAATGLLQGAVDPDEQNLSVQLIEGASHGLLTLRGDGSFDYAPDADWSGNDSFTFVVFDGVDTSALHTVSLTVTPVNDAPTFGPGWDVSAFVNDGLVVIRNWATGISAGPADESGQSVQFEMELVYGESQFFHVTPQVSVDGSLWFSTSGMAGTAHLTVRLRDDGGTQDGGADVSAAVERSIFVTDPSDIGGVPWSDAVNAPPTASFEQASLNVEVNENVAGGKIRFHVSLSKTSTEDSVLGWYIEPHSARPGVDYPATNGTLTIAAWTTSGTIEIPVLDDLLVRDDDRSFRLHLYAISNVVVENDCTATALIDEDEATLGIGGYYLADFESPPDASGALPIQLFTVALSKPLDHAVTVDVEAVGITAGPADFELLDSQVTFAPGETVKSVRVRILDDQEQSVDPNDANLKRGEVTEYYRLNLSVDDPHVILTGRYDTGVIFDDDWERYQITEPGGWEGQWVLLYDPANYPEGTVIDDPPLGPGFVVPPDWEGYGDIVYTYREDRWEWVKIPSYDDPVPTIRMESLDDQGLVEGRDTKARYRVFINGNYQHLPITVHYATTSISAAEGDDFAAATGSFTISDEYGYADIEIDLVADDVSEADELFFVHLTSFDGAIADGTVGAISVIQESRVTRVTFGPAAGEHAGVLEELSGNAGFRLFPDAEMLLGPDGRPLPGTDVGRNTVLVHATVSGLQIGDRVYFQVYDVDDDSRADEGDEQGNDNFGRLDVERIEGSNDIGGDSHYRPGTPNGGGARYLIRGLDADGHGNAWYGDKERKIVSGIVRITPTGELYAEAELLTTFQPGDNFRVVAVPQPEPGNDWDPNDGEIPAEIAGAFAHADVAGIGARPRGSQPMVHGAAASPTLTVWRRLHMEVDRMMSHSDVAPLGDRILARVAISRPSSAFLTEYTVNVIPMTRDGQAVTLDDIADNSFEGGILRIHQKNYQIAESRRDDDGTLRLVVRMEIGSSPIFFEGDQVDLFEDDFVMPDGNKNGWPQLRIAPDKPGLVDVVKRYMQDSSSANANRLADAFIQPEYEKLYRFNGYLPTVNHVDDALASDPNVTIDGTEYRGSASLNSAVFWTSYLAIAYQFARGQDYDSDRWVNGQMIPDPLEDPPVLSDSPSSAKGITGNEIVFETSFVFVESIWDHWQAHRKFDPSDPNFHQSQNPEDALARTAVHEIGHQLGGLHPPREFNETVQRMVDTKIDGIMTAGTHRVEAKQFVFGGASLNQLRSLKIVGKPLTDPT